MNRINLNGLWKAKGFLKQYNNFEETENVCEDCISFDALVPGNIQLDMARAGILPEDLYYSENIRLLEKYELYQWWYYRDFYLPVDFDLIENDAILDFSGVDTAAYYYINGQLIGKSQNMLVEHIFDIGKYLKKGKNFIVVRLDSPIKRASENEYYDYMLSLPQSFPGLTVRQAPHMYGWDIMPRAITAGLWKDVIIKLLPKTRFENYYLAPFSPDDKNVWLWFDYRVKISPEDYKRYYILIEGCCGESKFAFTERIDFFTNTARFPVDKVKLWYPIGYGEQPLYNVRIILTDGKKNIDEKVFKFGIKLLKPIGKDNAGDKFIFRLNGVSIMVKGTNYVPADVFHSRDKNRFAEILNNIIDSNCNLVRCWGGNVYESNEFFDMCDEKGIMVWQDFAMACGIYPLDGEFTNELKEEIKKVSLRLRNHVSLVLYAGDNECDLIYNYYKFNPSLNKLTRNIIPDELFKYDPFREYISSSPYFTKEIIEKYPSSEREKHLHENHLWGQRDYYKNNYFLNDKSDFVSEIGYMGCPSPESIKKFISEENIGKFDSDECILHSTAPFGKNGPFAYRNKLMTDQIKVMFDEIPSNIFDYALASQISQAEADKFFIEHIRQQKFIKSGIIWWNIQDGWPQFSDSVIDWYGEKKLAYYYIKQAQQNVCVSMGENDGENIPVYITNDTLQQIKGLLVVKDTKKNIILTQNFECGKNLSENVAQIPLLCSEYKVYLLQIELSDGKIFTNHYTQGSVPFNFKEYKSDLDIIANHYGTFSIKDIIK